MEAFKDELRRVGEQIGEILKNDPFPETVRPAVLGDAVRDYPGRGGKRIRPALVLWCYDFQLSGTGRRQLYSGDKRYEFRIQDGVPGLCR